jgi:hypothetical protein
MPTGTSRGGDIIGLWERACELFVNQWPDARSLVARMRNDTFRELFEAVQHNPAYSRRVGTAGIVAWSWQLQNGQSITIQHNPEVSVLSDWPLLPDNAAFVRSLTRTGTTQWVFDLGFHRTDVCIHTDIAICEYLAAKGLPRTIENRPTPRDDLSRLVNERASKADWNF